MKNILIINWDDNELPIKCSNLINSILEENPSTNINLLVPRNQDKYIKTMLNVKEVFYINTSKLNSVLNNRLYFAAHAINYIEEILEPVKDIKWDRIINLSDAEITKYIASYLDSEDIIGVREDIEGIEHYSNSWIEFKRNINNFLTTSPIHDLELSHFCSEYPYIYGGVKIKTVPSHNENAHKNISDLRSSKGDGAKVIGVNLIGASTLNNEERSFLKKVVKRIFVSELLVPLVVVSDNAQEKDIAKNLRDEIGEELFTVEADPIAFPSVLLNIDTLFSFNFDSKYVADLTETPSMIIFNSFKEAFSNGPSIDDSISIVCEDIKNLESKLIHDLLISNKIVKSENEIFGSSLFSVFRTKNNDHNIEFLPLTDESVSENYLNYFFSRNYTIRRESIHLNAFSINNALDCIPKNTLKNYTQAEKEKMTGVLKIILQALRVLKQVQSNSDQRRLFLLQIENIFDGDYSFSPLSIPINFFRLNLDRLSKGSFQKNLGKLETHLFSLKSEIQNLNQMFVDIENMKSKRTIKKPSHVQPVSV